MRRTRRVGWVRRNPFYQGMTARNQASTGFWAFKLGTVNSDELDHHTPAFDSVDWEKMWAPYDLPTYEEVLQFVQPGDVVLEIGAGDLRLALLAAKIARKVIAIEIQESILEKRLAKLSASLPANLEIVAGDALDWPFPKDITKGILMMRHCTHYKEYVEKLKAIGAVGLITNARWRMGVEYVALEEPGWNYEDLEIGWYSCACGAVGFKEGPPEMLMDTVNQLVFETNNCLKCRK